MDKLRFTVIIDKDEDGIYTAVVPALPGCHTQARDLKELDDRIIEVIKLCMGNQDHEEYIELREELL